MSDDKRILFFGDSFVQGVGDPELLGWTGRLMQATLRHGHELTYFNLGIRRNTSHDIEKRWPAECEDRLLPGSELYTVFSYGVNDTHIEQARRRVELDNTLAISKRLWQQAAARGKVLMIGPPPVNDDEHVQRLRILDGDLADLAGRLNIPYLSVIEDLLASGVWCDEIEAGDGSHPAAGGYTQLAALVELWPQWWFS